VLGSRYLQGRVTVVNWPMSRLDAIVSGQYLRTLVYGL
jgi:hypothetical protein